MGPFHHQMGAMRMPIPAMQHGGASPANNMMPPHSQPMMNGGGAPPPYYSPQQPMRPGMHHPNYTPGFGAQSPCDQQQQAMMAKNCMGMQPMGLQSRGGLPPDMVYHQQQTHHEQTPDGGMMMNCWPAQHQMPQPLTNLDSRVPVQKMQYFPNPANGTVNMNCS